ncbi:membrane lipoprotein lipid attachment site-like protein [Perilla frutescens var. hirtella]|nr:membrane lipoprotein lipid attachment site-like protein [Perilla frutescens var. hirtella]
MAPRLLNCFGRRSASSDEKVTAELTTEEQRRGGAVVVELFSSQGCATSPEAEVLFSRLGRGDFKVEVPLILVAYHVDIWDYMGWKDPFGSAQWTVRQKAYVESLHLDTMFTPQIVVQGRAQCLANDEEALLSCIASAPTFPAPSFQASFEKATRELLQVTVTVTGGVRAIKVGDEGANVMVALYESGLVTNCSGGVNNDRVLANDYVVRRLDKLCSLKDVSSRKSLSGTLNFSLWEGFNAAKCGLAVFLQNPSLHILGSQSFKLPEKL